MYMLRLYSAVIAFYKLIFYIICNVVTGGKQTLEKKIVNPKVNLNKKLIPKNILVIIHMKN